MPATNAVSERSFSALKRVKNYLRSSTEDNRLSHRLLLHVHKESTDALDLSKVANEFIERKEGRQAVWKVVWNEEKFQPDSTASLIDFSCTSDVM